MSEKKLRFHVVYASGEDSQYPASELNVHSAKSRGWASPRFCDYPQELGFAFDDGVVMLSQIQILSHQFKIAKRVELYLGFGPDYLHAEFKRLGYMSLESNERSEFKARELKSVYVSSEAQYIRLVIHECYLNPHNVSKQVCIIAVNFKGQTPDARGVLPAVPVRRPGHVGAGPRGPGVHDLSLDMKMDPETAATIRQVSDMKDKAVAEDDFETAKALKVVLSDLLQMGSQIARLIEEKNVAVDSEDYDRAKVIRDEINVVRTSIARRIASAGLGRMGPPGARGPQGSHSQASLRGDDRGDDRYYPEERGFPAVGGRGPGGPPSHARYPSDDMDGRGVGGGPRDRFRDYPDDDRPLADVAIAGHDDNDLDQTIGGESRDVNDFPGRGASIKSERDRGFPGDRAARPAAAAAGPVYNEDRPIKAAARAAAPEAVENPFGNGKAGAARGFPGAAAAAADGGGGEDDEEGGAFGGPTGSGEPADPEQLSGVENAASLPGPAQLKAAVAKDYAREISVFGEYVIRCFHSTQWALREAGLKKIDLSLSEYPVSKSELLSATAKLLAAVFNKEKNAQVILIAREILPKLLTECAHDVRKHDIVAALDSVIVGLVDKLGESNNRIRDAVIDALMHLADSESVGPATVAAAVMRKIPQKQATAWRPIKTRLEVVYMLVHAFGATASGPLSDEAIMGFMSSVNAYAHPNGEVREAAKALVVLLHSLKGASIERHLSGLRPQQLKEYQAAFEKGAPPEPPTLQKDKAPAAAAPAPAAKKAAPASGPAKAGPKSGGAAGKGKAAPASAPATDEEEDDGFCQFCEGCGPNATEQQLDLHYWQECPMLIGCSQCKQIIEISSLTTHLLDECEFRSKFRRCPRCKDAILDRDYDSHVAAKSCLPCSSPDTRCPLCHVDVGKKSDAWLVHLVDQGCPSNPRTA